MNGSMRYDIGDSALHNKDNVFLGSNPSSMCAMAAIKGAVREFHQTVGFKSPFPFSFFLQTLSSAELISLDRLHVSVIGMW